MTTAPKPKIRPVNPRFSSGPCSKHPGWSVEALKGALLGRYHRAKETKARLELALVKTRELLRLPPDYRVGIVPASDTGAVEMALWSLLGARGVDVLAFDAFGREWVTDIVEQLRLPDEGDDCGRRRAAGLGASRLSIATSSLPGTAPPPACGCRTPIGSRATGKA